MSGESVLGCAPSAQPEVLRERAFTILVPVVFRIE